MGKGGTWLAGGGGEEGRNNEVWRGGYSGGSKETGGRPIMGARRGGIYGGGR